MLDSIVGTVAEYGPLISFEHFNYVGIYYNGHKDVLTAENDVSQFGLIR